MSENRNEIVWFKSSLYRFWIKNLIKILTLPKKELDEIINELKKDKRLNKIEDITFVINERDSILNTKNKNCNPEGEYFRVLINWLYIWNFLVSNTDFFDKKTLKPKIQYYLLKVLFYNDWEISLSLFNNIYYQITKQDLNKNNFKKQISLLSRTLQDLFSIEWKSNNIIKYIKTIDAYKLNIKIIKIDEDLKKENERRKFKIK